MKRERRLTRRKALLIVVCVGVLLMLLYAGAGWLDKLRQKPETPPEPSRSSTDETLIEIDGKHYRRRSGLTTLLIAGVDQASDAQGGDLQGGQADFLRLLVLDSQRKTVAQLQIDRDTLTPVTVLGSTGRPSVRTLQISLAHAFWDDDIQGAEMTAQAVSQLLLGEEIDFYIVMSLDGIPVVNDWAGGVTVTLEEDFSDLDPAMTKGSVITLMGEQAEIYVRSRMTVGDGTNAARMERQQNYLAQLLSQVDARASADQNALTALVNALDGYLTTNMARGRIVNEFWAARDYERLPLLTPAGEHRQDGQGFTEFEVDPQSLQNIVLELFYEEVNKGNAG